MTDGIEFPEKDEPLREDVSWLGEMLGDILSEQGGDELFGRVERARAATRAWRGGDDGALVNLDELLRGLDPEAALETVRAFSTYFKLVNVAERVHRVRRRRDYQRAGEAQHGGPDDVLGRLVAAGVSAEEVGGVAETMTIETVFTAHPTEAVRKTMLTHEQAIARRLRDHIGLSEPTPEEEETLLGDLREIVTVGWQTEEHRAAKPTVADEVEHVLFYVLDGIYEIVPDFETGLRDALRRHLGLELARTAPILRCATWVGGDMDGNPLVGPDTVRATLKRQRELILERYVSELETLSRRLTQSRSRVTVSPSLEERLERYSALYPDVMARIPHTKVGMPYVVLLRLMAERIRRSAGEGTAEGYGSAAELVSDLEIARRSLEQNRGHDAGARLVERLCRRVRAFGFCLASLDLRQDSLVHRRVVGELMGEPGFGELDAAARTARLDRALDGRPQIPDDLSEETERTLELLRTVADMRRCHGEAAVGPHVISMARGPDDALALLEIARSAELVDDDGGVPLDVAPLFETVDDLENGPATMASLFRHPGYRDHLDRRGRRQMVMLGYSDSMKDSGIASARWALNRAQIELTALAREAGVALVLFHGRGGTVSRGGGKPRDAILAQPRDSLGDMLRFTEQGEIIHAKYGLREIGQRTLELLAGAVLEARTLPRDAVDDEALEVMEIVARESRAAYRGMVHEDPDFFAFYRDATPIDVIERLRIGSRPASRRGQRGIEDLRAIPWVFSWTQSRHVLTGWFGVGSGLEAAAKAAGVETLRRMARSWPFFGNLLSDVAMVLAKADMAIAGRYADLAGAGGARLQQVIETEFGRTVRHVCEVKEHAALLEDEPVLQRAIRLRNPYIDPMSLIQVDALARWREDGRSDPELERVLVSTVNGIARGLQNTG